MYLFYEDIFCFLLVDILKLGINVTSYAKSVKLTTAKNIYILDK